MGRPYKWPKINEFVWGYFTLGVRLEIMEIPQESKSFLVIKRPNLKKKKQKPPHNVVIFRKLSEIQIPGKKTQKY